MRPRVSKSENRSSIIEKIELHVAPAPIQLILTVTLLERLISMSLDDGQVGVEEGIADLVNEGEVSLTISLEVIEENSADAARFAAVLQVKILVAPLLESRIEVGIVSIAGCFDRAMKMDGVFRMRIIRRKVHSAAKPGRHLLFPDI